MQDKLHHNLMEERYYESQQHGALIILTRKAWFCYKLQYLPPDRPEVCY